MNESRVSQKLSLKWNDFQENLQTSVKSLYGNTDFADVTLACEDGQQLEAHNVILAGQVLVDKLFYSHHQINTNNINIICSAAGKMLQLQVSQLPPTQVGSINYRGCCGYS